MVILTMGNIKRMREVLEAITLLENKVEGLADDFYSMRETFGLLE